MDRARDLTRIYSSHPKLTWHVYHNKISTLCQYCSYMWTVTSADWQSQNITRMYSSNPNWRDMCLVITSPHCSLFYPVLPTYTDFFTKKTSMFRWKSNRTDLVLSQLTIRISHLGLALAPSVGATTRTTRPSELSICAISPGQPLNMCNTFVRPSKEAIECVMLVCAYSPRAQF